MKINLDSQTRLFRVHALLQIAQEQIEEMQNNSVFKHDNKARLNNTNVWINSLVESFTNACGSAEMNAYNQITQKIREFTNEIKFQSNEKDEDYLRKKIKRKLEDMIDEAFDNNTFPVVDKKRKDEKS